MGFPFRQKTNGKINYAAGHLKPGEMNRTEASYAERLKILEQAGEVLWWKFHCVNLRLPGGVFYSPDFLVMDSNGVLEIHEVKGNHWTDDARVKIKVAAASFPFRFLAMKKAKKCDGGGWAQEDF
jgi:hypothetical protein